MQSMDVEAPSSYSQRIRGALLHPDPEAQGARALLPRNKREYGFAGIFVALAVMLIVALCSVHSTPSGQAGDFTEGNHCVTPACVELAGTYLMNMNAEADPCDDFFEYACGGFVEKTPIPDDKSRYSVFDRLGESNQILLRQLLEDKGTTYEESQSRAIIKAQEFYSACMDLTAINQAGVAQMQAVYETANWFSITPDHPVDHEQDEWSNADWQELSRVLALLHGDNSVDALFGVHVGPDDKDSTSNSVFLFQGGLSLPSREYYVDKDIQLDEHLVLLQDHIVRATELLKRHGHEHWNEVTSRGEWEIRATRIVEFEQKLAMIMVPTEELRDPTKTYNKMPIVADQGMSLQSLAPHLWWSKEYFPHLMDKKGRKLKEVIVSTPTYLFEMSQLLEKTPRTIIIDYLQWHTLSSFMSELGKPFVDEVFRMRSMIFGMTKQPERWKKCVDQTESAFGFALGKLFVDHAFQGTSKSKSEEMIHGIKSSFKSILETLPWMDPQTQDLAEGKADAIMEKIGYPPWIMDPKKVDKYYGSQDVHLNSHFYNVQQWRMAETKRAIDKYGKPVDKTEWMMSPATVNAYYNPGYNEIVFPAGILQPPFFHRDYIHAVNYGAMGVVIGHEITHGFDDSGSQYDKEGNLKPWWPSQTREAFEEQTQCMAEQYGSYSIHGEYVNGKLTLGENIADNGGLKQAFQAYTNWRAESNGGEPEPTLPGVDLTAEQLFFVSFASVWCGSTRPQEQHRLLLTDPHSPGRFRVIGTLSNSKDFSQAFQCPVGSRMNPVDKCEVW